MFERTVKKTLSDDKLPRRHLKQQKSGLSLEKAVQRTKSFMHMIGMPC